MNNPNQIIYFDNNASTQVDKRVLDVMIPYFTDYYANANSTHIEGLRVNDAIAIARNQVAEIIRANENEIFFTSGSTESINIALKSVAENYSFRGKHIITASTEHSAVIDTCKYLETIGFEVTYLPVLNDGLVDLNELKKSLRKDTILVSVMLVNNETGVIQPIKNIAELTHSVGALFMTDATQAVGKISVDVDEMDIDLLCLSGHKIYAPKGIGALFVRQREKKVKLSPLLHGGGHEKGLRSGTLNVPSIIALGKACEIAKEEMYSNSIQIQKLITILENGLLNINGTFINGNRLNRIFNVSNICFTGNDANVMIGRLKHIAISTGSACSSLIFEPSHVLKAMGLKDDDAFASIRFSLGKYNTEEEVKTVINLFNDIVK